MDDKNKDTTSEVVFQKNKYKDVGTNLHSYQEQLTSYTKNNNLPSTETRGNNSSVEDSKDLTSKADAPKKSRGKRLVKAVVGSAYNTIDDHTARHVRSLSAYHEHFVVSTWNGFVQVYNDSSYYDAWVKVKWIDEKRLPFRAVVNLVQKDKEFNIEESFSLLLVTLAVATCLMLIAFYHTVFSIFVFFQTLSLVDAIGVVYWVVFFLFSVLIYMFYSFHCWVLKCDKFGNFGAFINDYKNLEVNAIFPYRL